MAKKNNGPIFEARVHRVVLSQGVFAERGLIPAASEDYRLLATDIDVLATEYQFNFHPCLSHYECKSGKISILDRILWMKGVRELLDADGSFLVVSTFDPDVLSFAKAIGIDLLTEADLAALEANLGFPDSWWPGRSRYRGLEVVRQMWRSHWSIEHPTKGWGMLKRMLTHVEVDSWQSLDYRTLNRSLRMLGELGEALGKPESDLQYECMCFTVGALCVQLAQVVLSVCADLVGHEPTARREYLSRRLVFGENDSRYALSLVTGTVELVKQAISRAGPIESTLLDTSRLTSKPVYAEDFFNLIERFLSNPLSARFVPLAAELRFFGPGGEIPQNLNQLRFAFDQGNALLDFVVGFVIRHFSIHSSVFTLMPSLLMKYDDREGGHKDGVK